jgi:hypothetical protein
MTNRTIAIVLVSMVPNWVAGCSGGLSQLPAAPTSVASPTIPLAVPATSAQERWNLTRTFTGHSGSEGCTLALDEINRVASDSVLLIQRSDESMRFFTADHNTYIGTAAGHEFSATETEAGPTLQCGEAQLRFRTEARVSGRFASDGRSLTGTETSVFLLESGRTIARHWDWQARRE